MSKPFDCVPVNSDFGFQVRMESESSFKFFKTASVPSLALAPAMLPGRRAVTTIIGAPPQFICRNQVNGLMVEERILKSWLAAA